MEHASAVATLDTRGTVTAWSEGARRLTGHAAEEAVGRDARELLAGDVPPEGLSGLSATVLLRHRDGSTVPAHVRALPLLGPAGTPQGWALTAGPPEPPTPP